jgi:DNA-binding CsgD family transcriptional regulator
MTQTHKLVTTLTVLAGPRGAGLSDALAALRQERRPHIEVRVSPGRKVELPSAISLRRYPRAVVVLDDLRWASQDTVVALAKLVRDLGTAGVRLLGALTLPVPAHLDTVGRTLFAELAADGLAQVVVVRPLSADEISRLVTETISAKPSASLVAHLRRLCAGRRELIAAALDGCRDFIRVVDRHAYLVPEHRLPHLPDTMDLLLEIRGLGSTGWSVAKAIAVLHPLGEMALPLVREVLGIPEREVLDVLNALCEQGFLRRTRTSWRFRVELVVSGLYERLGPYERRQLARCAVEALWSGRAECANRYWVADQLASVGPGLDDGRIVGELLNHSFAVLADKGEKVEIWLRAASTLATDRFVKAVALLARAMIGTLKGKYAEGLEAVDSFIHDVAAPREMGLVQEAHVQHVFLLHATGDLLATEAIANGQWWPWSDRPDEQIVTRASALYLLGRWREASELLTATEQQWRSQAISTYYGTINQALSELWLGRPALFEHALSTMDEWRGDERRRPQQLYDCIGALAVLGDLDRANELLAQNEEVLPGSTAAAERSVLAAMEGRFDEALELARLAIVIGSPYSCQPTKTSMSAYAATILVLRGRLSSAREIISCTKAAQPALPHLMAASESSLHVLSGELDLARTVLTDAVREAERSGVVATAESLWMLAVDLAMLAGDHVSLPEWIRRVGHIATATENERSELYRLSLAAISEQDRTSADAALRLARERAQPLELAATIDRLVRFGAADPALLSEAYDIAGGLNVLLYRHWFRTTMQAYNIAVPGRQVAVAENERLLAVLVSEGLGNKQLASALRISEKSVEGKLSRLFARTGYRSRVELAVAALNGQFDN